MASVSEIYINPDSQINNNDINVGRDQLGLCVRINIPNGTVLINNIWTATGLPGGLKPNTYVFVNNNVGNCDIRLPAIGTTNTTASFGHEIQIYNDNTSTGTITIQNSAAVVISVVAIGSGIIIRAANTNPPLSGTWRVIASSSATVPSATPTVQGIMYGLTPSVANSNTALGFQALNNYVAIGNQNNTAIGYQAALNLQPGSSQTVMIGSGTGSGFNNTTGNDNIISIGNCCKFSIDPSLPATDMTVIGNNILNFSTADIFLTALTNSYILGNNIGPRDNNVILNEVQIQDNVIIGNNILNPNGLSYNISFSNIIGTNICGNVIGISGNNIISSNSLNLYASGNNNTFIVQNSLNNFNNGTSNIVIGDNIGTALINTNRNIIFGTSSSNSLTTGSDNIIIGGSCNASTGASNNIILGRFANVNTGNDNIVFGRSSSAGNATDSIVIGRTANNGTGSTNIVIGRTAGLVGNTGSNNIVIGSSANPGAFSNTICLGNSATATVSNQFIFGNSASTITNFRWIAGIATDYTLPIAAPSTTQTLSIETNPGSANFGRIGYLVSSRRYKENIISVNDNFDIMKLEPVYFNYKTDDSKTRQFGLIAEDVDKAGFSQIVNYISNYKTKIIEKHIPQPDIIETDGDNEIRFKQDDIITNEIVIDIDENDKPIKINDDYDDVCPESVNYQMLSVILLKEMKNMKKQYNDEIKNLKDRITILENK